MKEVGGAVSSDVQKVTSLLLHQIASHARYTKAGQGHETGDPIRYHDCAFGFR